MVLVVSLCLLALGYFGTSFYLRTQVIEKINYLVNEASGEGLSLSSASWSKGLLRSQAIIKWNFPSPAAPSTIKIRIEHFLTFSERHGLTLIRTQGEGRLPKSARDQAQRIYRAIPEIKFTSVTDSSLDHTLDWQISPLLARDNHDLPKISLKKGLKGRIAIVRGQMLKSLRILVPHLSIRDLTAVESASVSDVQFYLGHDRKLDNHTMNIVTSLRNLKISNHRHNQEPLTTEIPQATIKVIVQDVSDALSRLFTQALIKKPARLGDEMQALEDARKAHGRFGINIDLPEGKAKFSGRLSLTQPLAEFGIRPLLQSLDAHVNLKIPRQTFRRYDQLSIINLAEMLRANFLRPHDDSYIAKITLKNGRIRANGTPFPAH